MKYYQQGDVLLKQCEKPKNVEILKTNILVSGQNDHLLKGKFKIGKAGNDIFVHSRGCTVVHSEHKPIVVQEGFYVLGHVQEFDHFLEESRKVID